MLFKNDFSYLCLPEEMCIMKQHITEWASPLIPYTGSYLVTSYFSKMPLT